MSSSARRIEHVGAGRHWCWLLRRWQEQPQFSVRLWCVASIPVILTVVGCITPVIIDNFVTADISTRIAIAVVLVSTMGLLMGSAFPIGMKYAARGLSDLTPWFWGLNGATSIFASVFAMAIAIFLSITAFWMGVGFYVVAAAMAFLASRGQNAAAT